MSARQGKGLFLEVLTGQPGPKPPLWMMRQAGRYLPEYRALRAKAADFLSFCFTPELAVEATLQPIRRFGFDAAIVFSDILVIPHAFGQEVRFVEGEGPRLAALDDAAAVDGLPREADLDRLGAVFETLRVTRAALPAEVALIGFCGAPWTVATYMIAGRGTPDQAPARLFAYREPEAFARLIDRLTQSSIAYLRAQIAAGADVVQVFDSWAGVLPESEFAAWSIAPIRRIIAALQESHPETPVIAFPRGMDMPAADFARLSGARAIGFDTSAYLKRHFADLPADVVSQGNLDPLALLAGGAALDSAIDALLMASAGRRHVVNLGHGILPPTPIAHVERLVERVREF